MSDLPIPTSIAASDEPGLTGRDRTRVIQAGAIGTALEFYDFGVYGYLAIVLAAKFFPQENPTAGLLSTLAAFAAAFVVRPIGGVIFGHIGDKISRKAALAISVIGIALATFLVGVLPTYSAVGIAAPTLLVLLRVIQGLSAGGEIGGAVSMISESVASRRRGFWCSLAQSGSLLGLLASSAVVGVVNLIFTSDQVQSWAWRLPFLLALPTGLIGLYVRLRLEESIAFLENKRQGSVSKVPIVDVFRHSKGAVLKAFGIAAVDFAAYYIVFVYMSIYLQGELGFSKSVAQWSTSATIFLAMLSLPYFGWLSDRVGRKKVIAGASIAMIVLPLPIFIMMGAGGPVLAIIGQLVFGLCVAAIMGVVWAALAELFGTGIRFTGMALGYNLSAALVGGLTPYVAQWLIGATGTQLAPAFWLIAIAVITLITVATMRETAQERLVHSVTSTDSVADTAELG